MIHAYTGDAWLAMRSARELMRESRASGVEVTELGEGMSAEQVSGLASQSGLFGSTGLFLDLDAAFSGQSGVRPRNELLKILPSLPADTLIIIVDATDSAARQKAYRAAGKLLHQPTPRFRALTDWVKAELKSQAVKHKPGVAEELVELFGEDLPVISSEVAKLALLNEEFTRERVREIAGKLALKDAFDLIDAIGSGDAAGALLVCRSLQEQGEVAARVLAALAWQFSLVARCVALLQDSDRVDEAQAARELGARPMAARKSLALARKLGGVRLRQVFEVLSEAEFAAKTGRDEAWALERAALLMTRIIAGR